MNIGKLRHYFQYQKPVVELDSDGARIETWVDIFSIKIPTEKMPGSGKDLIAADAVQSRNVGKLKVRYNALFVQPMRGLYKGTYYDIIAITEDNLSGIRYLILHYTTGTNEG